MKFIPPRCPYPDCEQFAQPEPRFFVRYGYYKPRCRRWPVPRFRCRSCGRTFSRQTFRHDYRDKRPECNVPLFKLLTSGCGLRQAGRQLELDVHSVQRKFRKIARTCRWLHRNLCWRLPAGRTFVFDEEETYEKASIKPLTLPILIDRDTYFMVATMVGPIRRLAPSGTGRRRQQESLERRNGRRRDRSRRSVQAVLTELRSRVDGGAVHLLSDEKAMYSRLIRIVFRDGATHDTTPSTQARGTFNPLFPINLTLAMSRDNCGRLRRDSWLVTEKRRCLQFQMCMFVVYRNYVRDRHNHDAPGDTPAVLLGLVDRALRADEVLRWRQDWRRSSCHPMSRSGLREVA